MKTEQTVPVEGIATGAIELLPAEVKFRSSLKSILPSCTPLTGTKNGHLVQAFTFVKSPISLEELVPLCHFANSWNMTFYIKGYPTRLKIQFNIKTQ